VADLVEIPGEGLAPAIREGGRMKVKVDVDHAGEAERVGLFAAGGIIEGVHLQSAHWIVAACRRPTREIVVARARVEPESAGAGSWPFVRGIVGQWRQWYPPASALAWSAELQAAAPSVDTDRPDPLPAPGVPYRGFVWEGVELPPLERRATVASLARGLSWACLLLGAPQLVTAALVAAIHVDVPLTSGSFQVMSAVVFVGMMAIYMRWVGRRQDLGVGRVLAFNTAAFKALVVYERRSPLSVSAARDASPAHPWSSANYIALAVVVATLVFTLVAAPLGRLDGSRLALHAALLAAKVASLPVVFALTYEGQWLAVRLFRSGRLRWLWPAACVFQRAVTVAPDDEQLEVAVRAFREVTRLEGGLRAGATPQRPAPSSSRAS
jgi:uncharacterized protein YqhQ